MRQAKLNPNRLTNAWVPFLVASTLLLNHHGRIAMVIPAELLQVNYAAELRYFLSEYYTSITLITFKKLVFENAQQEVVLLLGEKNGREKTGIRTIEIDGVDALKSLSSINPFTSELKDMDHSTEKWTMYFLEQREIDLLRKLKGHPDLTISGDVINVDVGIVTGRNDFFVLNNEQLEKNALQTYTQRIVGRSTYLAGIKFSEDDWKSSVDKGAAAFLFSPPNEPLDSLPNEIRDYIQRGEKNGVNKGYKCRIRKRWYIVPSVWTPDAFMLRQIHKYPKIIVNDACTTTTDTIHRVRMRNGYNAEQVASGFLNSLSFAFTEVTGRSYGGGVLELEPNEAEKIPLPLIGTDRLNLVEIDSLVRKDKIHTVLDITDHVLLKAGLGLDDNEIRSLRSIWEKLRDRRINRR